MRKEEPCFPSVLVGGFSDVRQINPFPFLVFTFRARRTDCRHGPPRRYDGRDTKPVGLQEPGGPAHKPVGELKHPCDQ